ncbi:unnamed protein product [Lampetra planeri]
MARPALREPSAPFTALPLCSLHHPAAFPEAESTDRVIDRRPLFEQAKGAIAAITSQGTVEEERGRRGGRSDLEWLAREQHADGPHSACIARGAFSAASGSSRQGAAVLVPARISPTTLSSLETQRDACSGRRESSSRTSRVSPRWVDSRRNIAPYRDTAKGSSGRRPPRCKNGADTKTSSSRDFAFRLEPREAEETAVTAVTAPQSWESGGHRWMERGASSPGKAPIESEE